jgi:hypothetical protein
VTGRRLLALLALAVALLAAHAWGFRMGHQAACRGGGGVVFPGGCAYDSRPPAQ